MPMHDYCIEAPLPTSKEVEQVKPERATGSSHQSEATITSVLDHEQQGWMPQEEQNLIRRLDRTLLPLLVVSYGLQYYDKAMLSQAALFGLRTDLDLDIGSRYSISASIFYLGFSVGSFPAILMAQRWPIERVVAGIIFAWGACLMCSAACTGWRGFYAQRFFLGFLESGVSPIFMLIVGGWYTKEEQALRVGAWYSATGYVSAVSPLINYGLGHIQGGRLSSWRYMYIVAGVITTLWAWVVLFLLPPDPSRAKQFGPRERYIAVARLRKNNAGIRDTEFKSGQALESVRDPRFWLSFSMAFLMMIANGPVSSFISIIISGFGFNRLHSLLLTLPAGAVVGTIELTASYAAYKFNGIRTWLIAVCQCATIASSILLWRLPRDEKGGLLFACYILASYSGGYAVLLGLTIANTAGYTKRLMTSSGVFVGYCLGNFLGPLLFRAQDAPVYASGFVSVLATSAAAMVLAIAYRYVCIHDNRKRDGTGVMEGFDHAFDDDVTDMKNPQFRYIL